MSRARTIGHLAWIVLVLAPSALAAGAHAPVPAAHRPTVAHPCSWTVVGSRDAGPQERGYEEQNPYLREPLDENRVPGPGGRTAVVVIDSLRQAHIFLEDSTTGLRRLLLRGSRPRWAPDGSRLACIVWRSRERPWVLALVDPKTRMVFEPQLAGVASEYRWSPDGRSIAVATDSPRGGGSRLCVVAVPSGAVRVIDTGRALTSYEQLAWSPDSRAIVASVVTPVGDFQRSDLWLFGIDGTRCPIALTRDVQETGARWISDAEILYTSELGTGVDLGLPESKVLTLDH